MINDGPPESFIQLRAWCHRQALRPRHSSNTKGWRKEEEEARGSFSEPDKANSGKKKKNKAGSSPVEYFLAVAGKGLTIQALLVALAKASGDVALLPPIRRLKGREQPAVTDKNGFHSFPGKQYLKNI